MSYRLLADWSVRFLPLAVSRVGSTAFSSICRFGATTSRMVKSFADNHLRCLLRSGLPTLPLPREIRIHRSQQVGNLATLETRKVPSTGCNSQATDRLGRYHSVQTDRKSCRKKSPRRKTAGNRVFCVSRIPHLGGKSPILTRLKMGPLGGESLIHKVGIRRVERYTARVVLWGRNVCGCRPRMS